MILLRWLLRGAVTLVCVGLLYMVAAWVGAAIQVGDTVDTPDRPVEIFVQSNGIHLEFVIETPDAGPLSVVAEQLPGPRPLYLAFGWGEREFFLKTPTWADFDLGVAIGALLWQSDVLMRVSPVYAAPSGPGTRRLHIGEDHARQISLFIETSIRFLEDGSPIPVDSALYDQAGIFLEGLGTYTPFYTCNEWVNDGLKQAGVPTAAWSPFPHGVMWNLE